MKIGDRIFVRGYIDEIRKDTVIIRNTGGYFGTDPSEVITGELPSAQPVQWIPCSERLPEESGRYLVTNTQWGAYHVDWNIYYVNVEGHCDGWLWEQGCIAWMPLPEPYDAESEDKE